MGLEEFLLYMQGSGVNAIVGFLLSFIVDYWPAYGNFDGKIKRLVFLALCMVVPLVGAGLGVVFNYQPFALEPTFWYALVAGFTAFMGGQVAHLRKM